MKSGFFLLNKPKGISSFGYLALLSKKLQIKKIGHAGTLDPLASGLLIAGVNQANKLLEFFLRAHKTYRFTVQLFQKTASGDLGTPVMQQQKPFLLSKAEITQIVNKFNNYTYLQTIPLYSATKVSGKRLYQYARSKQTVALPTKQVTIYRLNLMQYNQSNHTITFETECSKGTYVRALAQDLFKTLNIICTVRELTRTKIGYFSLDQALIVEDVTINNLIGPLVFLKQAHCQMIQLNQKLFPVVWKQDSGLNINQPLFLFLPSSIETHIVCYNYHNSFWTREKHLRLFNEDH